MTVLDVQKLSASYGAVTALKDVDVSVERGEITAVLGANGAGKTTLLRTISGLVRPASGEIYVDGVALSRVPVEEIARRGVAQVPEGRGVIEELTVEENMRLGSLMVKDRTERHSAIDEALERFPALQGRRRTHASHLSGGERQMLAIARALVSRPRLLLLDEPSLGLAPLVTAQLMATLCELVSSLQLSVLLVEQNARSALSVAKRAVVINLGHVVVSGEASAVASDSELRHHYLGF